MPAIPDSTRSSITLRILLHAKEHWPQLRELGVTCRGSFAYASAALPGEQEAQPLFRLRYGGSAHSFGFALYSFASGRYENAVLLTGFPTGTPQEALDTACTLYLAGTDGDPEAVPPTNLRTGPLSAPMVSQLTYEHVSALVSDVIVVTDEQAVQGTLDLADQAKLWAEPAAGCLMAAARQVIERTGSATRLGLVICGGNVTFRDMKAWSERYTLI